jgi:hypothetical protein
MSDIWEMHTAVRSNVEMMNRARVCECGARDWSKTRLSGVWRWLVLHAGIERIAFACRVCSRTLSLSRRQFLRLGAKG